MRHALALALGGLALAVLACGEAPDPESPSPPSPERESAAFDDVTAASGLDFVHRHGGRGRKYLPEIMGSGGSALDYDGDGWLDLYLVQAGAFPGTAAGPAPAPANRLYRNLGARSGGPVRFADVTERAGVGHGGYGMGAVAADYDSDGWVDLYLVNYGNDALLRNNGNGTFSEVTAEARIESPLWGSSAVFFDPDLDRDLDLYVVNYLDFSLAKHVDCGRPSAGVLSYCHPDVYLMAPDVYFRNRGDGTFEEATREAGLIDSTGKGLGAVAADFTHDGWPDLYVANDSTPNFFFRNRGDGTFEEVGLMLGVGYNEEGLTEAGMGTDFGDVNGDGFLDLFVTNLSAETNALYLGGRHAFDYATRQSGLWQPSFLRVGFGTELADFDNDGDLDLLVTNGHVIDNVELIDDAQSFEQPTQLFWNDGAGRFVEAPPQQTRDLAIPRVGRGTIAFDADNDGRLDVAITFNNDRARLFSNRLSAGPWLGLQLREPLGGVGAEVELETGKAKLELTGKVGSSYQTSGDPRFHFGIPDGGDSISLTIRLPESLGRSVVRLERLEPGRLYQLTLDGD